jgi:hypothetical protein
MADPDRTPGRRVPLFPKEHGAYVQLGLALAAGLVLGGGAWRSWVQALLTAVVFGLSEALLIQTGRRGPVAAETRIQSARLLAAGIPVALGLGIAAWAGAPGERLVALVGPGLLASALAALVWLGREHGTLGELAAAWTFASAAYPVARLGHADPGLAREATLALAGIQTLGTVTVRAFLVSLGRKGDRRPRLVPLALFALAAAAFPRLAAGLVPNALAAGWLLLRRTERMKRIGWMLTLASGTGLVIALAGLLRT